MHSRTKKREFSANCASCHGMDAGGRGLVAGILTKNTPDLTTVAKRNGKLLPHGPPIPRG